MAKLDLDRSRAAPISLRARRAGAATAAAAGARAAAAGASVVLAPLARRACTDGPWLGAAAARARRSERFELHYQPIVALRDGRVSHYEALLRLADDPAARCWPRARSCPRPSATG